MRKKSSDEAVVVIRAGTMRRKGPGTRLAVLYFAAILLVAAFLLFSDRPQNDQWMGAVYDLRHVLLLGFGGLFFLELTPLLGRRWIRKRSLYYAVAGAIIVLAAIRIEFSHLPWEWPRLIRNAVGGIGFVLLSAAFDRPLRREQDRLRGTPRRIIGIGAILIIVVVLRPLIPVGLDYAARSGEFPVVVDLREDWQQRFIELSDAMLFVGQAPPGWQERGNRNTTMISFEPAGGAGFMVSEIYQDWRGFAGIRFQIFSDLQTPLELVVHFDDQRGEALPQDRYVQQIAVRPGLNDYLIPVSALRGEGGEALTRRKIRHVGVHSPGHSERFRLFFSSFRLVEDAAIEKEASDDQGRSPTRDGEENDDD
jgi:hypothetical protein